MTAALAASGVSPEDSRKRAIRAMTLLQGGLVTARALDDRTLFPAMLTAMRQTLRASQEPAQ
jgi:putative aminopeptidase FrvX